MIGTIAVIVLVIIVVVACCSSSGDTSNNTNKNNVSNQRRNTSYNNHGYCECPSCGSPYYDGYCEECGYPDINQGWLGEQ